MKGQQTIDACILAGGREKGELAGIAPFGLKSLIEVGGKTLLERVYQPLRKSGLFRDIFITGPREIEEFARKLGARFLPEKEDAVENAALCARHSGAESLLVSGADLPCLTEEAVVDFVKNLSPGARALYPFVRDTVYEPVYGEAPRTWVKLKEGRFTGGNMVLAPGEVFIERETLLKKGFARRKNPLFMGMLLGPGFLIRYAAGVLSLSDVEEKLSLILGVPSRAIESTFAGMVLDVDKRSDYEFVRRLLG